MSPAGEMALAYARHGWPVFPLEPRGKRPLGLLAPNGFKNATRDQATVEGWWTQCPEANVGIPTGEAIGAWVLDFDCRNGDVGLETFESLQSEAAVRQTLQQITGSGGKQLFFAMPGFEVPSFGHDSMASVGLLGCDIKGASGYVVAPPSIHPDTGRPYTWDGMEEFSEQRILYAPAVLLEKLGRLIEQRAAPKASKPTPERITEGQRNDALFRLACSFRSKGLGEDEILPAVVAVNRARCLPQLPEPEVRRIVESACRYDPGLDGNSSPVIQVDMPLSEARMEDLNRLALFAGRMRFESIWRRGANTFARIHNGREAREVRWSSDAELLSFARSQSVLMNAGVLIPSPRKGDIRPKWETAVQLILMLTDRDRVDTGDPMVLETEERLARTFTLAGKPVVTKQESMADKMWLLKNYQRGRTSADLAPPCVFQAEGFVWVHVPTWRAWMSTPHGYNHLYTVKELHDGLAAVGFRSEPNVVRRRDGQRIQMDFWKGPIPDCLADDQKNE